VRILWNFQLEAVFGGGAAAGAPFFGADAPLSFTGVDDEYDPLRPNDYESYSKKRRDEKRRERDTEDRERYWTLVKKLMYVV